MILNGKLTPDSFFGMPAHAPLSRPKSDAVFTDTTILTIRYISDGASIASILPSALELDEAPVVTLQFYKYGASTIGTYRELIQMVEVRHKGKTYSYVPHIYLTNESAMIGGREWLGYPKKLASIDFEPDRITEGATSSASLCRPAGETLVKTLFVPGTYQGNLPPEGETLHMLNHKFIPSSIVGNAPSVSELVPVDFRVSEGEKWTGVASLRYTGASDFDPLHVMPVEKMLGSTLIRNAKLELLPTSDTNDITPI
jgi:acetoacetate decarboxylase